jgi:hypothetical protein
MPRTAVRDLLLQFIPCQGSILHAHKGTVSTVPNASKIEFLPIRAALCAMYSRTFYLLLTQAELNRIIQTFHPVAIIPLRHRCRFAFCSAESRLPRICG